MAPKPFGKPIGHAKTRMTFSLKLVLGLLAASVISAVFFSARAKRYPLLRESDGFFTPLFLIFLVLFAFVFANFLKRRWKRRSPWKSRFLLLKQLPLGLIMALPLAFLCAMFYEPMFQHFNGALGSNAPASEPCLVWKSSWKTVELWSPYWPDNIHKRVHDGMFPYQPPPGSLARTKVCRGLFGVKWVQDVEFEPICDPIEYMKR
jgi:CDP-diglyceride synthetase